MLKKMNKIVLDLVHTEGPGACLQVFRCLVRLPLRSRFETSPVGAKFTTKGFYPRVGKQVPV